MLGRVASRAGGFTLIELLAAVTVIVLLIAIVMPAMAGARRTAKRVICLQRQRQLALATAAYRVDHRSYYPQPAIDRDIPDAGGSNLSPTARAIQSGAVWFNSLDYYLGQPRLGYVAVEDRNYRRFKQDPVWEDWPPTVRQLNRTLKMNEYFGYTSIASGPPGAWSYFRGSQVRRPSLTVLFVDGRARDTSATDTVGATLFHAREIYAGLRHDDGANVLFADGHGSLERHRIRTTATGNRGWYPDDSGWHDLVWDFRK